MVFNPEAIKRSCQDFVGRLIKSDILTKNKHNLSQQAAMPPKGGGRGGGGLFPYKSDGDAPWKTSKTSLKFTRMYFYGYGLDSFSTPPPPPHPSHPKEVPILRQQIN